MTGKELLRFDGCSHVPANTIIDDEFLIRTSVTYYLRGCGIEKFEPLDAPLVASGGDSAIHDHTKLRHLVADARISIALALQRHLDNEQYRKRLAAAPHYHALRPYLSAAFLRLMVRASNLIGFRCPTGGELKLVTAYMNEIDRLEREWRTAGAI
jgi:hypothetical protein